MKLGKTIGDRIRYYRLQKDWSQTQLWKAVGMKQARLSRIENGSSQLYFWELERIAFFLEVPLSAFDTLRHYVQPNPAIGAHEPMAKDLQSPGPA